MISIKNVVKEYGKKEAIFTALNRVSFEIPDKSTAAIIGKSGSGKSTLMHIMSGLDHPTNGEVVIDKVSLSSMKDHEKDKFRSSKMGFIFQSFFVEANESAYQNVMLPLEIARVSRSNRKEMALKALKAVGLEDKVDAKAGNLSGGQKQRLAIARAIVNKPSIVFADEPTGNLDSATGEKVMKLLFNLNKQLGCTLILVTHDQELASRCQMQIIIKDGKIESIKNNKAKT